MNTNADLDNQLKIVTEKSATEPSIEWVQDGLRLCQEIIFTSVTDLKSRWLMKAEVLPGAIYNSAAAGDISQILKVIYMCVYIVDIEQLVNGR